MIFFDFNFIGTIGHSFSISFRKGMADAFRTNRFLPDHGFHAQIRVQQMRSAVSGQLSYPKILLLRSIPLYGFRPTHLQREPSRHRNLPTSLTAKTLPCRSPQPRRPDYLGRSQRKQRLAHLCRFCSNPHSTSSPPVCPRGLWRCLEADRLRFRLHHRRPLSFPLSLGSVPSAQSCDQNAYALGPSRQYSLLYPRYERQGTRFTDAGRIALGAGVLLHHGSRLHRFSTPATFPHNSAFFIVRAKTKLAYTRRSSRPIEKSTGLRSDQTIILVGPKTSVLYPDPLRRISYFDSENQKRLVFLTNNFPLPPLLIAQLYRCRWQVELFFKWIKQHLRIKAFYGTSENAIKTQIWIAISIYVLVAILKKELQLERSLNEILQVLSITLFEKSPINQVLSEVSLTPENQHPENQLFLFNS